MRNLVILSKIMRKKRTFVHFLLWAYGPTCMMQYLAFGHVEASCFRRTLSVTNLNM